MNTFLDVMKTRRSQYGLNKDVKLSNLEITKLVEEANLQCPTAFNMQSARTIILFGKHHDRLWDLTADTLRAIVPAEVFKSTKDKINSFKAAYGTILYFDDTAITEGFAKDFPLYKDNFGPWAQQANGMLQFAIWDILTEKGLGANLQHYNPLIDEKVSKEWNVSSTWKLIGQMPFGNPCDEPNKKIFAPINERVLVFE